jgi:ribosome-binding factor A
MSHRIQRVNQLIRQEISELRQRQAKDPRLGTFIAVTEVSTTADLKHAKVFISFLGSDEEKEETMTALAGASGFFRRELAKHLRLRHIPDLDFKWDDSIERGEHLLRLIDQVTSQDE